MMQQLIGEAMLFPEKQEQNLDKIQCIQMASHYVTCRHTGYILDAKDIIYVEEKNPDGKWQMACEPMSITGVLHYHGLKSARNKEGGLHFKSAEHIVSLLKNAIDKGDPTLEYRIINARELWRDDK